jgi:TonB family protein
MVRDQLAAVCTLLLLPASALGDTRTGHDVIARNRYVLAQAYPAEALKRGEEGDVVFALEIDKRGRLNSCQIVHSSGYRALDTATCEMLLAGATAKPIAAERGRHASAVREGIVEWRLPEGIPRPATIPPRDVTSANAIPEKLICRRQTKSGSLYITEKVCLTREQWAQSEQYARDDVLRMQSPQGNPGGSPP